MDLGARHLPAVLGVQRLLRAALSRAARERRRDAAGARAGARRAGDLSSRAHPAADDDRRDDRVRALLPRLCERLGEPRRADRAGLIGQFPIRPCPLWGGELCRFILPAAEPWGWRPRPWAVVRGRLRGGIGPPSPLRAAPPPSLHTKTQPHVPL